MPRKEVELPSRDVTFRRQYILCGKCPKPHGPYWYAFWWAGEWGQGKTRSKYIGSDAKFEALRRARSRGRQPWEHDTINMEILPAPSPATLHKAKPSPATCPPKSDRASWDKGYRPSSRTCAGCGDPILHKPGSGYEGFSTGDGDFHSACASASRYAKRPGARRTRARAKR